MRERGIRGRYASTSGLFSDPVDIRWGQILVIVADHPHAGWPSLPLHALPPHLAVPGGGARDIVRWQMEKAVGHHRWTGESPEELGGASTARTTTGMQVNFNAGRTSSTTASMRP